MATKKLSPADQQVVKDEQAATVRDEASKDADFVTAVAGLPYCTQQVELQRKKDEHGKP